MPERTLRRSELYELVWSQPVRTVASDIGISDVALAKACRKHRVPVPGRGYWRRKQCGHAVRRAPLPPLSGSTDPAITFRSIGGPPKATPTPSLEQAFEQQPENRVLVPNELGKPHRAVRRTLAVLRRQRRGTHPLVTTGGVDTFRVSVAPASLNRLERILQTLVVAFGARGYELVTGELGRSRLMIRVDGETLELEFKERTKRVLHTVTEREEVRRELNSGWEPARYDVVPTGALAIRAINGPWRTRAVRVGDRVNAPLETRLNEVLATMAETARLLKEEREAEEKRRREWEEQAKRREEKRERAELEAARVRRIEELVELWQRQEALRGFLNVVRDWMKVARPEVVPTADAWVQWAEAHLEAHHPADALFFEPLLKRDSSAYWHYAQPRLAGSELGRGPDFAPRDCRHLMKFPPPPLFLHDVGRIGRNPADPVESRNGRK